MAQSTRATQALLFMRQCRAQALKPQKHSPQTRSYNADSLDPSNFGNGKKLHLQDSPTSPLPSWRYARAAASDKTTPATNSESSSTTSTAIPESFSSTQSSSVTTTAPRNDNYTFPRARNAPIPRYRHNPAIPPGFLSYLKYTLLRFPEPSNPRLTSTPTFTALTNPYRAQKTWPPILTHLSETEQFHYEKKFRRRLLNKTISSRKTWDTWALFLRRFSVGFLILYFALIAEPSDPNTRLPPDGLRYWLYGKLRIGNEYGLWGRRVGEWIERQYAYYRVKHWRQWDPYNLRGWDETREINSLPKGKKAAPAIERELGSMSFE